ncbi:MAG: hypothetical protein WCD20_06240 [Rhodomicrobium sp.]
MTRENQPAAQSAAHRAASLLTGVLLLAGLAGCGGSLFQHSDTADATLKAKPTVALSSAEGVPQKYAAKVNEQLMASIKAKGVQIVDAKDAQYIIKPKYAAVPEPKHGTKVTYDIEVTDKAGNKIRSIGGEEIVSAKHGGDSWNHVTEDGVQRAAAKSATDVTAWIDNPNAPAAAVASAAPAPAAPVKVAAHTAPKAAPAQTASLAAAVVAPAATPAKHKAPAGPAEVVAVVPSVTGAPGDGKTALAEAMKRALKQQGIKLASAAKAGTYKIQGQVELGAAANGQQPITIRWVVVDPAGKQMEKTVVQNNKIVAGSLDGAWGETADQAAGAAASEVTKLLQKPASGEAHQAANGSAG